MTPPDLEAALTVVENERFSYKTYWDYVNFSRGRPLKCQDRSRFGHDVGKENCLGVSITRSQDAEPTTRSDELDERMKTYEEEWIYMAQVRHTGIF